jgi:hypothetical protein
MIQVSASGARVGLTPARRRRLRARFKTRGAVKLPGIVAESLLPRLQERAESCRYRPVAKRPWDRRVFADDPAFVTLLILLFRDLEIFQAVRDISGCGMVRRVTGAVFRTVPGTGQILDWHRDGGKGRAVALSVNISPGKFRGGSLEMRRGRKNLGRTNYSRPGDAALFGLSPRLFHRSTPLLAGKDKTILTIWFHF